MHLTLFKDWFDLILIRNKTEEYREAKLYWIKRIEGKLYKEIYFKNGYSKTAPFVRVSCNGI